MPVCFVLPKWNGRGRENLSEGKKVLRTLFPLIAVIALQNVIDVRGGARGQRDARDVQRDRAIRAALVNQIQFFAPDGGGRHRRGNDRHDVALLGSEGHFPSIKKNDAIGMRSAL